VLRPLRKPLVVMSPKSLLRHPRTTSPLEEFTDGSFQRILPDVAPKQSGAARRKIERVLCCSGKIYYELEDERDKLGRDDVAILRFEQLYPLQDEHIEKALAPYGADVPVVWVQEEPANMGAWSHFRVRFGERIIGRPFRGVSRPATASPATGSPSSHKIEQQEILGRAFAAS
jgi:2-oxoglutarate dehydrogenase E1 component